MMDQLATIRSIEQIVRALNSCRSQERFPSRTRFYSYSTSFNDLWSFETNQELAELDGRSAVVLLRDTPTSITHEATESQKYLTPLDWAVSWGLHRSRLGCGKMQSIPQILIVDPMHAGSRARQTDADRFFGLFPERSVAALPWINIIHLSSYTHQACFVVRLFEALRSQTNAQTKQVEIDLVRQIWQSFYIRPTSPSDNHSLANILGAELLTGDLGRSLDRQALRQHLQTLELLPASIHQTTPAAAQNERLASIANAAFDRLRGTARRRLTFVLVDDSQHKHNWFPFVARRLGLSGRIEGECGTPAVYATGAIGKFQARLHGTELASELLDRVRVVLTENCPLSWLLSEPIDLLLLDLRLFDLADLLQEARFYLEVIELFRQIAAKQTDPFGAWPMPSDDELSNAEHWCEGILANAAGVSRQDTVYMDVIALLPRLISVIDQDLPIVLFSSTQRRRVTELLRPYGNIFTDFVKPSLQLGQSSDTLVEALGRFDSAIDSAFGLLHARRVRQFLAERKIDVYWRGHIEKPSDERNSSPWHVQLLLDESERHGNLTAGGFLVVYPPGVSSRQISDTIYSAHPSIRAGKDKNRKAKLSGLLWNAIGILESQGLLAVPIALTGKRSATELAHSGWHDSDAFQDELVGDNLHRELMRCLIELGLFVFARQILPAAASVDFSFHAPTRVLPVTHEDAVCLDQVWGIRSTALGKSGKSRLMAAHMEKSSARPLLEEVLREYRGSTFEPKPILARAFGLSDDASHAERAQVHALHYLADGWLYDHSDPRLTQFNQLAIEGNYDSHLAALLRAHRHLLHGDLPASVSIGTEVALRIKQTHLSAALNAILIAISDAATTMKGRESIELMKALNGSVPQRKSSRICGVVRSVDERDGSIVIVSSGMEFHCPGRQVRCNARAGAQVEFEPRRGNRLGHYLASQLATADSEFVPTEHPM